MSAGNLTRIHLCSTLMDMCETQRLSRITVSALVKEAGVARGTFYNNFLDMNDLVNFIPMHYLASGDIPMYDPMNVRRAYEFAQQHKGFFCQLPDHMGQNNFRSTFNAWTQQIAYACFIDDGMSKDEREYRRMCIDLYCAGNLELFLNWCSSHMRWPLEVMMKAMIDMAPGFMREGTSVTPKTLEDAGELLFGRGACSESEADRG